MLFLWRCIITYFSIKDNNVGEINEKIFNGIRCKIKKEYSKYKNDGLYQSLSITSLLGAHLGILILIFLTKKKYINVNENLIKWNKTSKNLSDLRPPFIVKIPILYKASKLFLSIKPFKSEKVFTLLFLYSNQQFHFFYHL